MSILFDNNYPGADEDRKRHEDQRVAKLKARIAELEVENHRLREELQQRQTPHNDTFLRNGGW